MLHKSLLFRGLRSTIMRKLLPRPLVPGTVLVTQRQAAPQPIKAAIGVYFFRVQGRLPPVGSSNEVRT